MTEAISDRTFGIEIECGNHNGLNYVTMGDRLRRAGFTGYSVGHDGSGIEVRTPILKGAEGFDELERIMRYLVGVGCYVARADGMHTHIGAEGFSEDEEACKVLMRNWYLHQKHIEGMVSSHRAGSYVCSKVTAKESEEFGQFMKNQPTIKYWGPRLRSLGLAGVPRKGTIEFRLHEGCLDFVKATAWVQFCQRMLDHAIQERTVLSCRSKTQLLKDLALPQEAISILRKRQPLMPRVNGAPAPQWAEPDGVNRA